MAGSLITTSYVSDNGLAYNIRIDETNAKIDACGFNLGASASANEAGRFLKASSSFPIEMRYAIVKGTDADDKTVSRTLYVESTAADIWDNPTTVDLENSLPDYSQPGQGGYLTNVTVTSLIGEKRYFLPANDTGIIDGTTGDN